MSRRIVRLLVTTMAVGFIVVGSGCASEDDIFKLRVEAKEAKGAAERAEVAANDADCGDVGEFVGAEGGGGGG